MKLPDTHLVIRRVFFQYTENQTTFASLLSTAKTARQVYPPPVVVQQMFNMIRK